MRIRFISDTDNTKLTRKRWQVRVAVVIYFGFVIFEGCHNSQSGKLIFIMAVVSFIIGFLLA
jgi:hypothetical protein